MPRPGEERPVPDRFDDVDADPRELGEREKLLILRMRDERRLCFKAQSRHAGMKLSSLLQEID